MTGGMNARGVCMARRCAWQGMCMAGGMHVRGVCMAGGHVWWGGMCNRVGMHAMHAPHTTRYSRSMRRQYASYWNVFLLTVITARQRSCGKVMFSQVSGPTQPLSMVHWTSLYRHHTTTSPAPTPNRHETWDTPLLVITGGHYCRPFKLVHLRTPPPGVTSGGCH